MQGENELPESLKILLVLEDKTRANYLQETLWSINPIYHTDYAEDGKEAITILETNYYDLIFLDMDLKVMKADLVLWFIRNKLKGPIKKSVIIGLEGRKEVEEAKGNGINALIQLPIPAVELSGIIFSHFENRETTSFVDENILFDLDRLRSVSSSDDEFETRLEEMLKDISDELVKARKSAEMKDYTLAFKCLHKINNKALYLGSMNFVSFLVKGQQEARDEMPEKLLASIGELEEIWGEIKMELENVPFVP